MLFIKKWGSHADESDDEMKHVCDNVVATIVMVFAVMLMNVMKIMEMTTMEEMVRVNIMLMNGWYWPLKVWSTGWRPPSAEEREDPWSLSPSTVNSLPNGFPWNSGGPNLTGCTTAWCALCGAPLCTANAPPATQVVKVEVGTERPRPLSYQSTEVSCP